MGIWEVALHLERTPSGGILRLMGTWRGGGLAKKSVWLEQLNSGLVRKKSDKKLRKEELDRGGIYLLLHRP